MQRRLPPALIDAVLAPGAGVIASAPLVFAWAPVQSLLGFGVLAFVVARVRGRRGRAARVALFAAALLASGCLWIYDGIRGDGHNAVWLASVLFAGFVTLYAGLHAAVFALVDACASRTQRGPEVGAFVLAGAWIVAEWLRSVGEWALPWLLVGTQQVDLPVFAGLLPIGGVYLAGFVAVFVAALAGQALAQRVAGAAWVRGGAAVAIGLGVVAAVDRIAWTDADGAPIEVALLQSNYPQQDKWDDAARERAKVELLAALETTPRGVLVTPETYLLDGVQQAHGDYWSRLAGRARASGVHVMVGGIYVDDSGSDAPPRYYNAIVQVAPGRADVYAKRRLVPFGEYMPWTAIPGAAWVYRDVFNYPLRGLARAGEELGGNLYAAGHEVAPSVCYEIAFASDIAQRARTAGWLLNVSNDAWFDSRSYRHQAEQIARTRARESRRWVVRANNVGRTALIAPDGSVLRADEGVATVLRGRIQPRAGLTPYQLVGDAVVAGIALVTALMGLLAAIRARMRASRGDFGWEGP